MSANQDSDKQRKTLKAHFVDIIRGRGPRKPAPVRHAPNSESRNGPRRELPEGEPSQEDPELKNHKVTFDSKGNAVWKLESQTESDDLVDETVDMLGCLDNAELSIEEDARDKRPADKSGKDPYNNPES